MFCSRLKEFLSKNDLQYDDRDVSQDEAAFEELRNLGVMTTPVSVVDEEVVVGFDEEKLRSLLEIS